MPEDRADEVIALRIVRHALPNVTATAYDDGSSDGMVDALITYPDGRTAALEIVGDLDPAYRAVLERLTKAGQVLEAPTLKYSWRITVEDTAWIRQLRDEIVPLLEFIETEPTRASLPGRTEPVGTMQPLLATPSQSSASQHARPERFHGSSPKMIISARVLVGRAGDPNALPVWAAQLLTDTASDVPRKLAASGYPERHAFIWTTFTTPYQVASTLDADALPTQAPDLPDGVTHLWIGGCHGGARTLNWSPDCGWSDAYRIPSDGRINLPVS